MAAEEGNGTLAISAPVKVTAEQLGLNLGEEYAGQLDFDLGNLTAWDPAPVEPSNYTGPDREERCKDVAQAMTQSLVNQLFTLPAEPIKGGRLATLPDPTTRLPREKPVPKQKELTKWQKFAQTKGIVKKKRSKLVFDETSQDWKRRHGYKRADDINDIPIIEAKPGDKPGDDPFAEMERTKKERVANNRKSQLNNAKLAAKAGNLPATLKLAAALPSGPAGSGVSNSKAAGAKSLPKTKRKELKEEIKLASRLSGVATASLGKFDKRLVGEKEGERAPLGKRRQFMPVTDTEKERTKISGMADKFLRERSEDVLDVRKAIQKLEGQAREEKRAAKEAMYTGRGAGKGGKPAGKEEGGSAGGDQGGRGGGRGGRGGKGRPGGVKAGRVEKAGGGGRGSGRGGGRGGSRGGSRGRGGGRGKR